MSLTLRMFPPSKKSYGFHKIVKNTKTNSQNIEFDFEILVFVLLGYCTAFLKY